MADSKTKRLKPSVVKSNIDSNDAIDAIPDYKPANQDYLKPELAALRADMIAKQAKETQDYATFQASRDAAVAAEWAYNDAIRAARTQVRAQYGENSDQLQAVGLKKKSEYKSRKTKPKSE